MSPRPHARSALALRLALAALAPALLFAPAGAGAASTSRAEPPTSPSWLARAQAHITAREYQASEAAQGWQAPNRRQGFRTWFSRDGVRVADRATDDATLVELRLARAGRAGALAPLAPGELVPDGSRVEIRRPGLVEWFENAPAGLEHGWTVESAPPGIGPLAFELLVEAADAAVVDDQLLLRTPGGRRLRYAKLLAWDAVGRPLEAHMALAAPASNRLRVVVSDATRTGVPAAYPITIDPLLTAVEDSFLESLQTSSRFGVRVASAGDVNGDGFADVIIGADDFDAGETNEGAAFIFYGTSAGIADASTLGALTQIESDQADAGLAHVASAGDVNGDGFDDVIVGVPFYDAGQVDEGIAMIFLGGAGGIADGDPGNADFVLEVNEPGAFFGADVSSAGDVNGDKRDDVVVGAYRYDATTGGLEGAAFVFHGSTLAIGPAADATIVGGTTNERFGRAVAAAGDVNGDGFADLLVGAELLDTQPGDDSGGAAVFHGGPTGITASAVGDADGLVAVDQRDAHAGIRVAGAGDVNGDGYADVLIGADDFDAGEVDEGAAWIAHGGPSGIGLHTGVASLATQIEGDQASASLGFGLDGAGDLNGDGYADVVVGARFYDDGETNEGAAFVFLGSATGIPDGGASSADYTFTLDQASAEVGTSVAGAGDVNGDGYADLVIGAYRYDTTATGSNEGVAVVLHGGAEGVLDATPTSAAALLQADQTFAAMGRSVSSAGDVNGDGFDDVIIGAPEFDARGAVFVFHGGAAGVGSGSPINADGMIESDQTLSGFGFAVSSAGDVNGDGFGDVIVGAVNYDNGESTEGAAFLFHGGATGVGDRVLPAADGMIESDQTNASLGSSVAAAGDVNGDGFADVIVQALRFDSGEVDEGAAFIFHGRSTGIGNRSPADADATIESDQVDAGISGSVAGAGDVNGDGLADVIVGFGSYDAGETGEGVVFVFHGSVAGIGARTPASADGMIEGDQAGAGLGRAIASAGDLNGDGFGDVIVGAPAFDVTAGANAGAAFVFYGGAAGIGNRSAFSAGGSILGDQAATLLGVSVAGAGDVNGDGFADVAVGASSYDAGFESEGAVFVFHNRTGFIGSNFASDADAMIRGDQEFAFLGSTVAGAGDVNGDGFADLVGGAPSFDAGQTNEGIALVLHGGGPGEPRTLRLRQLTVGLAPVAPGGLNCCSEAFVVSDAFVVEMDAWHPEGTGRVRLEVETCPPGVPFGDASCLNDLSPTWVPVQPDGSGGESVTLRTTVDGLPPETLYRWRARVLHAPFFGGEESPTAGPWRRPHGQSVWGDIRVPEPGFGVGLAFGLLAMARARRGGTRGVARSRRPAHALIALAALSPILLSTVAGPASASEFSAAVHEWSYVLGQCGDVVSSSNPSSTGVPTHPWPGHGISLITSASDPGDLSSTFFFQISPHCDHFVPAAIDWMTHTGHRVDE